MERNERITHLLRKYLSGDYTGQELDEWLHHAAEEPDDGPMAQGIAEALDGAIPENAQENVLLLADGIRARLLQRTKPASVRRLLPKIAAAAAAVLLIASVVGYFVVDSRKSVVDSPGMAEILPGGNRATLTLADGRAITLSSEHEGISVQDGITYLDGSQVMENNILNSQFSTFNSITTPKGGTYQITLPDGSKVWLNAASTLKYPSRFSEDSREVILEGEAFFEIVAMDRTRITDARERSGSGSRASVMRAPFKVKTAGQTVEVLGTEFNISAYAEDPETKTTLVEGKVRLLVGATGASVPLVPGEQGLLVNGVIDRKQVDTEPYTAWKDGRFHFDGEQIQTVMQKLARWYDIEVEYRGAVTTHRFSGILSRFDHINQVLSKLSKTQQVHFKQEGRKIIVMP